MIRASSMHRVCTNKPVFPQPHVLTDLERALDTACEKYLKESYDPAQLRRYAETKGVMTNAKSAISWYEQHAAARADLLPVGAKSYAKELWLESNCGIYFDTRSSEATQMENGQLQEPPAIELLGIRYQRPFKKNTTRMNLGFTTGEWDIDYTFYDGPDTKVLEIRDVKIPKGPRQFRSKYKIDSEYYWQLIAYIKLASSREHYDRVDAYLDNILMPLHPIVLAKMRKKLTPEAWQKLLATEQAIIDLPVDHRVKTFKLECDLQSELRFMDSRIEKFQYYYDRLDYETCMNYYHEN